MSGEKRYGVNKCKGITILKAGTLNVWEMIRQLLLLRHTTVVAARKLPHYKLLRMTQHSTYRLTRWNIPKNH